MKNRNQYSPLVTIPFNSITHARNGKIILFPESMGEVPSLIFRDRSLIMWKGRGSKSSLIYSKKGGGAKTVLAILKDGYKRC